MWSYFLANVILGIPACVAAVVISKKRTKRICDEQKYNDCELCNNLKKINAPPYTSKYKYECSKYGSFDKQPLYCKSWDPRSIIK